MQAFELQKFDFPENFVGFLNFIKSIEINYYIGVVKYYEERRSVSYEES